MSAETLTIGTSMALAVIGLLMSLYSLNLQRTEVAKQNNRMIELLEEIEAKI